MRHSAASAATIRARLTTQLADPIPMRRGSLTERTVQCWRPGCPCQDHPEARHGPYFSLTRAVGGKTQTRLIPAAKVETVRRQIETGRQFRDATELYWAACERLADAELAPGTPRGGRGGKRGLCATLQTEVAREIGALVGAGAADGGDFEAIETAARRRSAARGGAGARAAAECGPLGPRGPHGAVRVRPPARYAGRRAKTFESVLGPLTLDRAYYHCAACDAGFCPRDRALGLDDTSLSPGGHADGRRGGRDGQLRGGPRVAARPGRRGRADLPRRARGRSAGRARSPPTNTP